MFILLSHLEKHLRQYIFEFLITKHVSLLITKILNMRNCVAPNPNYVIVK